MDNISKEGKELLERLAVINRQKEELQNEIYKKEAAKREQDEAKIKELQLEIAKIQGVELDESEELAEENLSFIERNKLWASKNMAYVQMFIGIVAFASLVYLFKTIEKNINTENAKLSQEQLIGSKINAFNNSNLQRIVFEQIVVLPSILMALLMISIAFPSVFFYVVNVFKTKLDFGDDFMHKLTPFQRVIITVVIFVGVMLALSNGHSVNTF